MRKWMGIGLTAMAAFTAPMMVHAEDDPALNFITHHIWACEGASYNRMVPGNTLPWELNFLVSLDEDNIFKAGNAKMFYTIDSVTYTALYSSTGYAYSTPEDGTGVYFERMERGDSDDISKYELAWLNYMKLVVRVPPGVSNTPPFRLEGQLQHSSGDIDTVSCVARDDY